LVHTTSLEVELECDVCAVLDLLGTLVVVELLVAPNNTNCVYTYERIIRPSSELKK
jgi:hypothetical protein